MDGDDLNAVVKKAKKENRSIELLEYVLSQTDSNREPEAYQELVLLVEKERKLAYGR